jgi:hypothetical protein
MGSLLPIKCVRLVETYNTSILDDYPEELQNAMKKEAAIVCAGKIPKEYDSDTPERTVLMQLIHNHYDPEKKEKRKMNPNIMFIGGPKSLTTHWSDEYKKMIYIFGERHHWSTNCTEFDDYNPDTMMLAEDFFLQLFENNDTFIDFYLETQKGKNPNFSIGNQLRLIKLINYFTQCINYPSRGAELCRRSRMHYIDARFEFEEEEEEVVDEFGFQEPGVKQVVQGVNFVSWALNQKLDTLSKLVSFLKTEKCKNMLECLKTKDTQKFNDFWHSQLDIPLVTKELSQTDKKISEWVKSKIIKVAEQHRKVFDEKIPEDLAEYIADIEKDIGTSSEEETTSWIQENFLNEEFIGSLITINCVVQDAYCLARMFKDFNMKKMKEKAYPGATDQPAQAHNIIIYAGDLHARNYRECLKFLGFKDLEKIEDSHSKELCINIKDFPPLFSYWPEKFDVDQPPPVRQTSKRQVDVDQPLPVRQTSKRQVEEEQPPPVRQTSKDKLKKKYT